MWTIHLFFQAGTPSRKHPISLPPLHLSWPPMPEQTGQMRMRQVTGKGARVPGPDPNASYKLRYTPPEGSEERETSFAITGAHLRKTWMAYGARVEGDQPVWNPDFVSTLSRTAMS